MRRRRNFYLWLLVASGAFGCKPAGVAQPLPPAGDIRPLDARLQTRDSPPAPSADANSPEGNRLLPDLKGLPQEVLVGTDIEPLSSYLVQVQPVRAGKYSAEIGGAVLRADITTGAVPSLKRQFKEPGMKGSMSTYS